MAGTKEGGLKTRETNYARHGRNHYARIGAIGGRKGSDDGVIKGFAANRKLAREAGKIGGRISRRTKNKISEETLNTL